MCRGEEGRTKPWTDKSTKLVLFCVMVCMVAPEIQASLQAEPLCFATCSAVCCPSGSVHTRWGFFPVERRSKVSGEASLCELLHKYTPQGESAANKLHLGYFLYEGCT